MYTKEQLEQMEIPQLMGIAEELSINVSQNDSQESVIYAILDKAAEQSASGESVHALSRKTPIGCILSVARMVKTLMLKAGE